jgi:hypothetical protein
MGPYHNALDYSSGFEATDFDRRPPTVFPKLRQNRFVPEPRVVGRSCVMPEGMSGLGDENSVLMRLGSHISSLIPDPRARAPARDRRVRPTRRSRARRPTAVRGRGGRGADAVELLDQEPNTRIRIAEPEQL